MLLRRLLPQTTKTSKFILSNYFPNLNFRYNSTSIKMAEHASMENSLQEIIRKLKEFAPLNLAGSWDNVGLLVDPGTGSNIKNILLTNDLTEDVVREAITLKIGLIISYHPNIFQGLKSVSQTTWKERIVVDCIKNNIAVYSPHTTWDAVKGGVNDWLAASFSIETSVPILQEPTNPEIGCGRYVTLKKPIQVNEAVKLVKHHLGLPHLRLALARHKDKDDVIKTVAVCAGSGSSVLNGVKADLYLTGEMLHHDVLDATHKHIHVILCNHSDSERGFLRKFQTKLQTEILKDEAKVFVSEVDSDPLKTV